MSREVLGESLSAVMDGEAEELELRRVLAAAGEDAEVRARWARYQLARDVMHRQAVSPQLDLAAAVSAAIAAEEQAPQQAPRARRGWAQQVGRVAVAASVALAVLVCVRFYNDDQADGVGAGPQLAEQAAVPAPSQAPLLPTVRTPQGPAVLASYPAPSAEESVKPAVSAEEEAQILRELPAQDGAAAEPAPAR